MMEFKIQDRINIERSPLRETVMFVFRGINESPFLFEEKVGLIFSEEELMKELKIREETVKDDESLRDIFLSPPKKKVVEDFLSLKYDYLSQDNPWVQLRYKRFPIIDCVLVSHASSQHRLHGKNIDKSLLDPNDFSIYEVNEEIPRNTGFKVT